MNTVGHGLLALVKKQAAVGKIIKRKGRGWWRNIPLR